MQIAAAERNWFGFVPAPQNTDLPNKNLEAAIFGVLFFPSMHRSCDNLHSVNNGYRASKIA
jgi:hypothetical protein